MDVLGSLVVSGKAIDKELVGTILKPFLRIDGETCTVIPGSKWAKLSNEAKLLLFLLARKGMKALELPIEHEDVSPSEVEQEVGIKGGSLRPMLRKLLDQKVLAQTSDGLYYIPTYSLESVKSLAESWN